MLIESFAIILILYVMGIILGYYFRVPLMYVFSAFLIILSLLVLITDNGLFIEKIIYNTSAGAPEIIKTPLINPEFWIFVHFSLLSIPLILFVRELFTV